MTNIHAQRLNDVIGATTAPNVMSLRRDVITPRLRAKAVAQAAPERSHGLLDAIAMLGVAVGLYTMLNGDPALAAELQPYVGPVMRMIDAVATEARAIWSVIARG